MLRTQQQVCALWFSCCTVSYVALWRSTGKSEQLVCMLWSPALNCQTSGKLPGKSTISLPSVCWEFWVVNTKAPSAFFILRCVPCGLHVPWSQAQQHHPRRRQLHSNFPPPDCLRAAIAGRWGSRSEGDFTLSCTIATRREVMGERNTAHSSSHSVCDRIVMEVRPARRHTAQHSSHTVTQKETGRTSTCMQSRQLSPGGVVTCVMGILRRNYRLRPFTPVFAKWAGRVQHLLVTICSNAAWIKHLTACTHLIPWDTGIVCY